MRSSLMAKEDHPGPTAWRQSATGGDAVQSVLICTPCTTTPSRRGPRKPDQSAFASAFGGAISSLPADFVSGAFSDVGAAAAAGADGSFGNSVIKRCSGVGVQRQCKSTLKSPL